MNKKTIATAIIAGTIGLGEMQGQENTVAYQNETKKEQTYQVLTTAQHDEKTFKVEINNTNPTTQAKLTKLQEFIKTQPEENQEELKKFYQLVQKFYQLVEEYKKNPSSDLFQKLDETQNDLDDISRNYDEGTYVVTIVTEVANTTGNIELQNNEGKLGEAKKKTEEAKKKTEEAKKKTEEAKKKTEEAKKKTEEAKKKTEEIHKTWEESEKTLEQSEKEKQRGIDFNIWAQNIQDKKGSPKERKKEAQRLYDIAKPHGRLTDGEADQRLFDTYTKKLGMKFD